MPPLAERPGDVLPLVQHFHVSGKPLSPQARLAVAAASVAGQCPRTAQCDPACRAARARRTHRSRRSQPAAAAGGAPGRFRAGTGPQPDRTGTGACARRHRPGRGRSGHEPAGAVPAHGPLRHTARGMMSRSFTFRLFLRLLPVLALAAAMPWLLAYWLDRGWEVAVVSGIVLLGLMWVVLRRATAPMRSLFRALAGTTSSYRDGEYNFGVHWRGDDELAQLVQAHTELGVVLREQRQSLVQRELMLDAMVQNTPVAMLLVSAGWRRYSPRHLLQCRRAQAVARRLAAGGGSGLMRCSIKCRPNCAKPSPVAATACSPCARKKAMKTTSRSTICRTAASISMAASTSCCRSGC